jgi:hypothetical protein
MRDGRPSAPPGQRAEQADDRQQAEIGVLPKLPLGGAAFSSPLYSTARRVAARRNARMALMLVTGAALVSGTAVAIALVVRADRLARGPGLVREPQLAAAPQWVAAPARRAPRLPLRTSVRQAAAARAGGRAGPTGATATPVGPAAASSVSATHRQFTAPQAAARPKPAPQRAPEAARARDTVVRKAARTAPRAERELRKPPLPLQPSRAQVIAAMQRITPAVNACFGQRHGKAKVLLTVIGRTGRVTTARVIGQRGQVGSCIARAVRRARLPAFGQRKLQISFPFAH